MKGGMGRIAREGLPRLIAIGMAALGMAAAMSDAEARVEFGASAGEADITMGCMFPMAGRAGIYGRDSIGGMKVALAELASQGKSAPRIRVIVDDDRSKASFAVRLAEDFIRQDRVGVLCGIVSSGVAQAVTQVAERRKTVFIGTDHASSRMTVEGRNKYYFRVSSDTLTSMAAGARYMAKLQAVHGWTRLAFIGPDYDYGHMSFFDLQSSLSALGVHYDTVAELWPKLYEPDYSAYIAALHKAKADIVVCALWGGDFIAFVKQAMSAGLLAETRLANFDTGGNYDMLTALGDKPLPNLILSARHHNNWPDTARNRAFVASFHQLEGRFPTYAAEGAYAGVMAVARAIQKSGGKTDAASLISSLENLSLPLPKDPDGFVSTIDAETHQILQAQAIGIPQANTAYPPAKIMLGNWTVYPAAELIPPPALLQQRRQAAAKSPPVQ